MFFKKHQREQISHANIALLLALFASVFYFFINYYFLFSFTAPSDPLQYVLPALQPEDGFPYLDRVMLWLWIRLVTLLPIPLEQVGGVATLLLSSFTLLLLTWHLAKKINLIAGGFFVFFYVASPAILDVASYTYPMQLLTFFLALTVVLMDSSKSLKISIFFGGFGFVLIIFSKVQGYIFAVFIFAYIVYFSKNYKEFIRYVLFAALGSLVGLLGVLLVITLVDDFGIVLSLFKSYFSGNAQIQYAGRSAGGFPDFHIFLLEPTAIASLLGMAFVWFFTKFSILRIWSAVGLLQLFGLLFIYAITQRGGPVIANYFIDSYAIGLVALSGILGMLFNTIRFKFTASLIIVIASLLAFVFWIFTVQNANGFYAPRLLLKSNFSVLLGFIVWFGFYLLYLYIVKPRASLLVYSVLMISIPTLLGIERGVQGAEFRRDYNLVYHDTSKYIRRLGVKEGPVWASFQFPRRNVQTSTARLKRVYSAFYDNTNLKIIFSPQEPPNYKTIVTNRVELFVKHGLKGGDLPKNRAIDIEKILINKINDISAYGIRVEALEGRCFVQKTLMGEQGYLNLSPMPSKEQFFVQLDYSDDLQVSLNNVNQRLFLSVPKVELEEDASVKLYIKYQVSNKWVQRVSVVKKNDDVTNLTTIVPKEASNLSYGLIVSGNNLTKAIKLPNILFAQTENTQFQQTTNIWVLEK